MKISQKVSKPARTVQLTSKTGPSLKTQTQETYCDAPGFQPGLLTLMSRVNRVDFGQTMVNLGHHLDNITDNP
jgi:hypothetical protein